MQLDLLKKNAEFINNKELTDGLDTEFRLFPSINFSHVVVVSLVYCWELISDGKLATQMQHTPWYIYGEVS